MVTPTVRRSTLLAVVLLALSCAQGCRAIEGIFKAGFWVGFLLAVIALVGVFAVVRGLGR